MLNFLQTFLNYRQRDVRSEIRLLKVDSSESACPVFTTLVLRAILPISHENVHKVLEIRIWNIKFVTRWLVACIIQFSLTTRNVTLYYKTLQLS